MYFLECKSRLRMCLKENYSDLPNNEYSRHYSASPKPSLSICDVKISTQNQVKSKNITTSADVLISKVYSTVSARGPHKMNALKIIGRVSINTWPSPSNENASILGRVLGLDSAVGSSLAAATIFYF